ncbi:hypothetical protein CLM71_09810 [Serratia sp. MYb239]|nr:hypothetical protein CLM71_09810 [Serratia sp. MYb239]
MYEIASCKKTIGHDTGEPLRDMAMTAWASTWRIPQFKPIGVPTMGAYRNEGAGFAPCGELLVRVGWILS